MSHAEIVEQVIAHVMAICKQRVEATTPLHEVIDANKSVFDADLGEVEIMQIVVWIEATYGFDVEIDDIIPENFGTAHALATYIDRKRPK